MKEVGKIYSAVDADELEAGDIVEGTNRESFLGRKLGVSHSIAEPKPTYRPFNDANELVATWVKMRDCDGVAPNTLPLIWVKAKDLEHRGIIVEFSPFSVTLGGETISHSFKEMLEYFTFLAGTLFGVKEA